METKPPKALTGKAAKIWNGPGTLADSDIWKSFEERRPRQGLEYHQWVAETAAKYGCQESEVRNIVALQHNAMRLALQAGTMTIGQQLAELVGASLHDALAQVKGALTAVKPTPSGVDEKGRIVYKELPNWRIRLEAADALFRVHGGYAPQQIQVQSTNYNLDVSTEELLARLDHLRSELQSSEPKLLDSGGATARRGTKGKKGANGRVLLADGMHADEGRAGSD